MVLRTIEIGLEVEKERQEKVIRKIKELYPDLNVVVEDNKVLVRGYLGNYKRRDNIMFILSGGKYGKALQIPETARWHHLTTMIFLETTLLRTL